MSAFTALNLEPEETVDQEVDDSREIQIEEALKLYQNALKYHSQGPEFTDAAAAAYKALFQSEIFQYPEAASEFSKEQIGTVNDHVSVADHEATTLLPTGTVDGSPNSLLQIIYLSYKNYGQFVLDTVKYQSRDQGDSDSDNTAVIAAGAKALKSFADALERDDSDLDLWRKAARIGSILSSHRVIRFCLESVLVTDEENSYEASDLLGLDELSAFQDLKRELNLLDDDLSTIQTPKVEARRAISEALKRRMDPFSFLAPPRTALDPAGEQKRLHASRSERKSLVSTSRTWTGVGKAIYRCLLEQQSTDTLMPGCAVKLDVPAKSNLGVDKDVPETEVDSKGTSIAGAPSGPGSPEVQKSSKIEGHNSVSSTVAEHILPNQSEQGSPDMIEEQVNIQLNNGIKETLERGEDVNAPELEATCEATGAPSMSLPTRKRTSTSAGNDETNEGGRTKSKRLRARESIVDMTVQEEEVKVDLSKYYEDQLIEISQADDIVFTTLEQILDPLEVHEMSHLRQFQNLQSTSIQDDVEQTTMKSPIVVAMLDLQAALASWSEEKGQTFLVADGANDLDGIGSSRNVGLALFQEHTKPALPPAAADSSMPEDEGLDDFVNTINSDWMLPQTSALRWIEALMLPPPSSSGSSDGLERESSYKRAHWPPALKELAVNLIILEDEVLVQKLDQQLLLLEDRLLTQMSTGHTGLTHEELRYAEMAQAIFELHLDVYCAITNPSSEVDKITRIKQRDRLCRWNDMASAFVNHYAQQENVNLADGLAIRYLFAATLHATKAEDAVQEHITLCLRDLQHLLERSGNPKILLPNNAAMPEISISAVSQEMSRLSTLDFFMGMFNSEDADPVTVIESLEPILDPVIDSFPVEADGEVKAPLDKVHPSQYHLPTQAQELVQFLEQGNASLTLFLWRRLRDAYKAIDYPPKIVSCYLRSLQVVMEEITAPKRQDELPEKRQITLLKWLRYLDEVMIKLMSLVLNGPNAFECVDSSHLKDSLTAVVRLGFILHAFVVHEDSVRVGQISSTTPRSAAVNRAFEKVKDRLRDMQMRLWVILYTLIRDGILQHQALFPNALEDKINYLRFVHNAMGLRQYCRHANKSFLKLIKQEFISAKNWQDYDNDFAQVLSDLHGLKFGYGIGDQDHSCTPDVLDKKTANQIIPFVMGQVTRVNMKDLAKSELKGTLEKMQQVMGTYKTTPSLSFNKRVINQYLKSPINPRELYSCLKGLGDLPTKPIKTDSATIAETGWYFLQGQPALTRFKSVKRVNPTPTDDVDIAATFFRQDLDHNVEKWETWYRLAQVYDVKIDDDILWTADKINNQRGELATLQRNAIHCYAMAVSTALRTAESTPDTAEKISDMYTDFAIRLYSSSREPLSMQAFSLDNYERHYSAETTQQMYKAKPFAEMKLYAVWNLATYLLRQALIDKPKKWITHYYLGKCLWKMFRYTSDPRAIRSKPGVDELLEVLIETVENLPQRKDNRVDPILEPHFKLVSIVHKLVRSGLLTPKRGSEALQVSQWAKKVHLSEEEDGWEPYVLQILKNLSQADKSNWHHRIIARAAHCIYDDNENDLAAALGAKHEFTQQIFTKTMTLQVWKPENERPGRHFVYTTRYVSFFIGILYQLNDRPNLDQLARRIRRKPGDFMNHGKLWEAICNTYIQLLRKLGKAQLGLDQTVFGSMNQEDFAKKSTKVETWAHELETSPSVIDILRDAIELKKLNNSLMKGTAFDDLIADAYTKVYEAYYQDHPEPDADAAQPDVRMSSFLAPATIASLSQVDGAAESTISTPGSVSSNARSLLPSTTPTATASNPQGTDNASSTGPAPAKPNRNRPVTRRELIRRAEALISRPNATQTSAVSKAPSQTPAKALRPVVEIRTSSTPSVSAKAEETQSGDGANTSANPIMEQPSSPNTRRVSIAVASAAQSPTAGDDDNEGSNGGDAADESGSELSDLDEDEEMDLERKAQILFPGLMAVRNRKDSTSSSNHSEGGPDGQASEHGDENGEDEADNNNEDVDIEDEANTATRDDPADGDGVDDVEDQDTLMADA